MIKTVHDCKEFQLTKQKLPRTNVMFCWVYVESFIRTQRAEFSQETRMSRVQGISESVLRQIDCK